MAKVLQNIGINCTVILDAAVGADNFNLSKIKVGNFFY